MDVTIKSTELYGEVTAAESKSYAHRALICGYLGGNGDSALLRNDACDDVRATKRCLQALFSEEKPLLDCNESGSTLRFLLPLAAALGKESTFVGSGRLMQRPLGGLAETLAAHGAVVTADGNTVQIRGKLKAGRYEIDGGVSSQYVSGLLMALPLCGDSEIVIKNRLVSRSYVDVTLDVMQRFGVTVTATESGYSIKKQSYGKANVAEGDWSNAAFYLVGGALCGEVTVRGLNMNSKQGDRKIIELLREMGASVTVSGDAVTVKKSQLKAIRTDVDEIPDLVPILAVAMASASGESVIMNAKRLTEKESDRFCGVINLINAFGSCAKRQDYDIIVSSAGGAGGICGADDVEINASGDHRMVMAAAIAAAARKGQTVIRGANAVKKSEPEFFEKFGKLAVCKPKITEEI